MRGEALLPPPMLADVERALKPAPPLEADLRAFVTAQLGRVLPADERRGVEAYFREVVLGSRAVEALGVLSRHRPRSQLPVVDVGSGLGSFVLLANSVGMPALGVEPGREEVELARRRAGELGLDPGTFHHGGGEELPLAEGGASAVLVHDVLEHVRDWRAVLREAWRALAPEGVVYVKGPSYAVRFFEPHYRLPWLPLLPRGAAGLYLRLLRRDPGYFESVFYVRRGAVLRYLRALGFELSFPRVDKLGDPASINRPWARTLARTLGGPARRSPLAARLLAENPLQATIDVVARKPAP